MHSQQKRLKQLPMEEHSFKTFMSHVCAQIKCVAGQDQPGFESFIASGHRHLAMQISKLTVCRLKWDLKVNSALLSTGPKNKRTMWHGCEQVEIQDTLYVSRIHIFTHMTVSLLFSIGVLTTDSLCLIGSGSCQDHISFMFIAASFCYCPWWCHFLGSFIKDNYIHLDPITCISTPSPPLFYAFMSTNKPC